MNKNAACNRNEIAEAAARRFQAEASIIVSPGPRNALNDGKHENIDRSCERIDHLSS